ncbi:PucR family transcriptional regulator [Gandjariella thermophila]|uniref:PucR family transcriptional regulator n=1 Tax=Gandjariella thermophila TaxID=1931992 RepID=A0A4D4J1E1_9PSEU|nr:PucR family transcriptional regulator [Gandjariella thermophila]GDY28618.1 PucR family transcriptional regulator [Gandjariella thermophila]
MGPTLATLVDTPGLDLRVCAAAGALRRRVHWVHVSELADPTPFLEGGELLLTTGIGPGDDPAGQAEYVRRLCAAGVSALGYGTGLPAPVVPAGLLAAAEEHGLPVVEVPKRTPFIAISKAVARAVASEEFAAVTAAYRAQQSLTAAALRPDAPAAVVHRLAAALRVWAVLLDAAGGVRCAEPRDGVDRVGGLRAEIARLRGHRAPASASFAVAGDEVVLQSLGAEGRVRGFLAVGRPDRLSPTDRHVLNTAVSLLTVAAERSRALDAAHRELRRGVLRLALAGEVAAARATAAGELPAEPLVVAHVAGTREALADAADALDTHAARAGEPVFHAPLDADAPLVVLVAAEGALRPWLAELPEQVRGLRVGCAEPAALTELARAHRQAGQALAAAHRCGRAALGFAEIAAGGVLPLVDETAGRAFAAALLDPLLRHDGSGRGELVDSLRAWLAHHGQWDPAAAALGVHRHTLRNRITRAAALLDRDLGSADVRAELWFALRLLGAGEPP